MTPVMTLPRSTWRFATSSGKAVGRRARSCVIAAITQDRALLPTAFPELVANLQVLLGKVITGVMLSLVFLTEIFRAAIQVRSDDVPAGAALGQVIEGRQASGERVRVFEG